MFNSIKSKNTYVLTNISLSLVGHEPNITTLAPYKWNISCANFVACSFNLFAATLYQKVS